MRLFVEIHGDAFHSWTFEDGIKKFKVFSDRLEEIFDYAWDHGYRTVLK